jgi:hypothetical protein
MPSTIYKPPAGATQAPAQVLEVRVGGDKTIMMFEPGVARALDPQLVAAANAAIAAAVASSTQAAGPVEM